MEILLKVELQDLVMQFREYEADCNKRSGADEGARAFQFCAIALEETLRCHGVHIGQTIECGSVQAAHISFD